MEILSSKYLLKHVREEGGAYGVNAMHPSGLNLFSSYDDPNVLRTVEQFRRGCDWIRSGGFSAKDVEEARMSLFGDIDAPREPQSYGFDELFTKKTEAERQVQRACLLDATRSGLLEVAQRAYDVRSDSMQTFVFGNKKSVKEVETKANWIIEDLTH